MIGKVVRGSHVGGLLRYLYGPGRANEHVDPHMVASWDDSPAALEPAIRGDGRRSFADLTSKLEQPFLLAADAEKDRKVWHCSLRAAPNDRRLSDAEWGDVARAVVERTGFAPAGDDGGCRWVAVRHADDHIHLVVTLARQDGGRVSMSNDYYRLGEACRWAERRFGLTATARRDRTAPKRASRAETEKARRSGRAEPARARLRREVRAAAAGAGDGAQFLSLLESAGLMVRPRYSQRDPGVITGYAVALPGDRARNGAPVWFGGGKLAADLSWTKLARRWQSGGGAPATDPRAWERAVRIVRSGAADVRLLASTDPGAACDAASAAGDNLFAVAHAVEGRRGGPLTDAATAFERASQELYGRTPRRTGTGDGLRSLARLLTASRHAHRGDAVQFLHLVQQLIALSDAVAHLRDVQGRAAQAAAARHAADRLRTVAPPRTPTHVVRQHRPKQPSTVRSRG